MQGAASTAGLFAWLFRLTALCLGPQTISIKSILVVQCRDQLTVMTLLTSQVVTSST